MTLCGQAYRDGKASANGDFWKRPGAPRRKREKILAAAAAARRVKPGLKEFARFCRDLPSGLKAHVPDDQRTARCCDAGCPFAGAAPPRLCARARRAVR